MKKNQHEFNRCRMYVFLHAIPLFSSGVLPEAQYVECKWVSVRFSQNVRHVVSRRLRPQHRLGMIPGVVDISATRSARSAIKIYAAVSQMISYDLRQSQSISLISHNLDVEPHIF